MMIKFSRRDLLLAGGTLTATGLTIPGNAVPAMPTKPLPTFAGAMNPLANVDRELRPIAAQILSAASKTPPVERDLPSLRQIAEKKAPPKRPDVSVEEKHIAGPAGAPDVVVCVVNAKRGEPRPAILHTHGGGFVAGAARSQLNMVQDTAMKLGCVVVTVEYRLAPETRYKGSIEDNYAALKWLYRHADDLGVDRERIAVMGESAGGGHAALLAITARDRGEVPIVFQSLIYPMLDDRTGSSRPVPEHIGRVLRTSEMNSFGWRSFLGQQPGGAHVPAAAVPARVQNLAGLPPAFIGVGAIDLFVEEDLSYAQRLISAGVATEVLVLPGAFHAFDGLAPDTAIARRFTAAKLDALRRAFAG